MNGNEYLVLSQATSHTSTLTCLCPPTFADAASKHATQAFFDCLRAEMEQYEIRVTVISPGYIHTSLSLNAITADGSRYGGEAPFLSFFLSFLRFYLTLERGEGREKEDRNIDV